MESNGLATIVAIGHTTEELARAQWAMLQDNHLLHILGIRAGGVVTYAIVPKVGFGAEIDQMTAANSMKGPT